MFRERIILSDLEKELNTPEIVVLTGMRQVGKTTLLRHIYENITTENKVFFDAENPLHRKIFEEENYDNIWGNLSEFNIIKDKKAYIFIDEIQHMPELSQVVKYLHDHYQVKFFLTGSSSYYLKNLFPESMAGRKVVFELYPLTFSEFLVFRDKKRKLPSSISERAQIKTDVKYHLYKEDFEEYLRWGGFPKVVLEKDQHRKKKYLSDIFTSYFEQDVKDLADFRNTNKLRDCIILLASRVGSKLDISKLANTLEVSRQTIYNYLAFLESTYFLHPVPRFSKNLDRKLSGSNKVFLCDVGLLQLLADVNSGQILENGVLQSFWPLNKEISYFASSRSRAEIDFILDKKTAIEVKRNGDSSDVSKLARSAKSLNLPEFYVASQFYSEQEKVILAQDL